MRTLVRLLAVVAVASLGLAACSSDDSAVDCDLGNEITADFDAVDQSEEAPSVESLEAILAKVDSFDAPSEIADDVDTVSENLGVFIDELSSDAPDFDAIGAAAEELNGAGENVEAYLADNC